MKQILFLIVFLPISVWAQSNFDKGEKLFDEEKYDEAQVLFETILKTNPSDLKTIEYLGDIAGLNKSWDKAIVYHTSD